MAACIVRLETGGYPGGTKTSSVSTKLRLTSWLAHQDSRSIRRTIHYSKFSHGCCRDPNKIVQLQRDHRLSAALSSLMSDFRLALCGPAELRSWPPSPPT